MSGYVPTEGEILTVALPHELIRATVTAVLDRNTIMADLNLAQPFTRIHGYSFGQRLKFRRAGDVLGEKWELAGGQRQMPPPVSGPSPRLAADDEHAPLPERPLLKQKVKRRSDAEAEKTRKSHAGQ